MLQDLDTTIDNLLQAAAAPTRLSSAEISFATPEKGFAPTLGDRALNLFLYEIKENRDLRTVEPLREPVGNLIVRRRPPMRVDCCYLVTSWSKSMTKIVDEHELLGVAYAWLSKFQIVPERFFAGALVGQPYAPPSLLAQWDAAKNIGEFWSALGIAPRPFFNLTVTIALDLEQSLTDAIVTTVSTTYRTPSPGSGEEITVIGGTVRDLGGNATPGAWVRLDPAGLTQVADPRGRFIFANVARGGGYSLTALAPGHAQPASRANFEIPSLSGEYDLTFPT